MTGSGYPQVEDEALPLSLHEDMSTNDLMAFQAAAGRAAYHAEALVMQAWLLFLAVDLERREGANAIELWFDEETPDFQATAKLHTDHGSITWSRPGHTSISVNLPSLASAAADRVHLDGHRSWLSDAMSYMPSSIRARGAINDHRGGSAPTPLDASALRELSLCLALPDATQRAQFNATVLANKMQSATNEAAVSATPRPRV